MSFDMPGPVTSLDRPGNAVVSLQGKCSAVTFHFCQPTDLDVTSRNLRISVSAMRTVSVFQVVE